MTLNSAEFRQAMACFTTGVTIVTVDLDGKVHGMTANAVASVSLEPMLLLVCVDHGASTHAHLHTKKRFGINVLAEDQRAVSEFYADPMRLHERVENEINVRFDRTAHGTPVLHGALAYLECRLNEEHTAGDHTIFIAEVEDIRLRAGVPLLFFHGKYWKIGDDAP